MRISQIASTISTQPGGRIRPNPAETVEKGLELGEDSVQQDLFALSTGISGVQASKAFIDLGKLKGDGSWQKGAYAAASALSGSTATGLALVDTVESLFSDPIQRGFFALAGSLAGQEQVAGLKDLTTGYGKSPTENGLLGVASAIAGPEGAQEALEVGLAEGRDVHEGTYFAVATALAGGVRELGPTLDIARDFASSQALSGPYAVAAALSGADSAASVLRMAEDLGQTVQEKALFGVVGGLVGAERGPGFVRLARALADQESQVPAFAVAAALTGVDATPEQVGAASAMVLAFEPS